MAEGKNVCTSEVAETFVRSAVKEFLLQNKGQYNESSIPALVAIDGFPRSPEQVRYMLDLTERLGMETQVIWLFAPVGVRIGRLKTRDGSEAFKAALTYRRIIEEDGQLQATHSELVRAGVFIKEVRNE